MSEVDQKSVASKKDKNKISTLYGHQNVWDQLAEDYANVGQKLINVAIIIIIIIII